MCSLLLSEMVSERQLKPPLDVTSVFALCAGLPNSSGLALLRSLDLTSVPHGNLNGILSTRRGVGFGRTGHVRLLLHGAVLEHGRHWDTTNAFPQFAFDGQTEVISTSSSTTSASGRIGDLLFDVGNRNLNLRDVCPRSACLPHHCR